MKIVRMLHFKKIICLFLFGVLWHTHGFSQLSPGGPFGEGGPSAGSNDEAADPGDPGDPGQDPDLPLDSNVFLLVAAGVGYGLKKGWDLKQKIKREKQLASANAVNYEDFNK